MPSASEDRSAGIVLRGIDVAAIVEAHGLDLSEVDRTLIREALRRTPSERIAGHTAAARNVRSLAGAARRTQS